LIISQIQIIKNHCSVEYVLPTLCSNIDILPDCTVCSVGQQQEFWWAYIEAEDKLECAIQLLKQYNGASPTVVLTALMQHFDNNSF